jgi:hypothetical protein
MGVSGTLRIDQRKELQQTLHDMQSAPMKERQLLGFTLLVASFVIILVHRSERLLKSVKSMMLL